jgi:hypothetical protein
MANYYAKVSFVIPLPPAQQDWAIAELDCGFDAENATNALCEKQGDTVWITNDSDDLNVEELAARLQTIMKQFSVSGKWGFEWSHDCSAPRLDAFGGGAVIITQDALEFINTADWLFEHGCTNGAS